MDQLIGIGYKNIGAYLELESYWNKCRYTLQ